MSHARIRRLFSISIFILVLLLSIYLFLHSSIFMVNRIYATGASKVSQEEILALAGISTGQNIFGVDTELAVRALQVHPMIKSARVVRHLPHQLEIQVVERQIWGLIPYQNILICVDDEGVCIDRISSFSLLDYPILTFEQLPERINWGQTIYPDAVRQAQKIHEALGEEKDKISEYHYKNSSDEMELTTIKKTQIKFGNPDRFQEKIGYIKAVFSLEEEVGREGHEVLQYVDLRFAGEPVMKTR